jgi:hypothetical protein
VPITKLPVKISSDGDHKDKKDDGRDEKLCDSSAWFPYAHEHIDPHNCVEPSPPELGSALGCLMSLFGVMMEEVLVDQGGVGQGRQTTHDSQEKKRKQVLKISCIYKTNRRNEAIRKFSYLKRDMTYLSLLICLGMGTGIPSSS